MKRTTLGILTAAMAIPAATAQAQVAPPSTLELTGVVRDFLGRSDGTVSGVSGHPDFQLQPSSGFGHYMGNIATELDEDMKPVFLGGGFKVSRQWQDAEGRPICYTLFDEAMGDSPGIEGSADPGAITSADSFRQWFRDVPGRNLSKELQLSFSRGSDGVYTFQDSTFFPLDNDMLGNVGRSHNYHFTFELQTEFTYHHGTGQIFRFTGDDDVWVFIDGRLVIDIGGVHSAVSQTVEVDRLGLEDGRKYTLSFFFAERHTVASNFRIDTTLQLETVELPPVAANYD